MVPVGIEPAVRYDPQQVDDTGLPWVARSLAVRAGELVGGRVVVAEHSSRAYLVRVAEVVESGDGDVLSWRVRRGP